MHLFSDAGAFHKITAAKIGHSNLPDFVKLNQVFFQCLADCCYIIIAAVPDPSRRSKPPNIVCTQPCKEFRCLLLVLLTRVQNYKMVAAAQASKFFLL